MRFKRLFIVDIFYIIIRMCGSLTNRIDTISYSYDITASKEELSMLKLFGLFAQNLNKITFVGIHFFALAVFFVPVTFLAIELCIVLYFIRMMGITAGYHRDLSHLSYKSNRWIRFIFAFIGCSAMQKGPLWWAAHHRRHHQHSDMEGDPHSPVKRGWFYAHIGWIFSGKQNENDLSNVKDLVKFSELRWLNKYHLLPGLCLSVICFLLHEWSGVIWGFALSTVLLYHGTFLVNSVCHLFGKRRFNTSDESRDNAFVAIILTLGEGWHNGHHARQARARHGVYWYELDFTYYLLWFLSLFGCVWDIKKAPPKMIKPTRS